MQYLKKYWWAVLLLAVVGVILYNRETIAKRLSGGDTKGDDKKNPDPNDNPAPAPNTTTGTTLDENKVLKLESPVMKGKEVEELQKMLNTELTFLKANLSSAVVPNFTIPAGVPSMSALVVDGQFGAKTETRLKELTGKNEITLAVLRTVLQHRKPEIIRAVAAAAANPINSLNATSK